MKKYKLAVLISHPIQYQSPLFKKLSSEDDINLSVYYCSTAGATDVYDPQFKVKLKWDIPLFDGYKYKFLRNYSPWPRISIFGLINPGIILEIFRNNYDAIIIHGWNLCTNWLALAAALIKGTPIFLRGENPLNQEMTRGTVNRIIKKLILKPFFRKVSAVLYIGEQNRKFYDYYDVPFRKLFFCPYAVDNERYIDSYLLLKKNKEDLKKSENLPLDESIILFSGKLIDKKRPMDLLMAYALVENPQKSLLFVGDGPLLKNLKDYVLKNKLKNVYFKGFVNQKNLPRYYALADIFVLPSGPGETWGLVVNEAMCSALPVVVSDMVGCADDLVKNLVNGFTFSCGNIKDLAAHLNDLIIDGKRRTVFGAASLRIIEKYSYKEDVSGILDALKLYKGK